MLTLRDFVQENPIREKIVFTQDKRALRKAVDILALEGIMVFNLKIFTIEEFLLDVFPHKNIIGDIIPEIMFALQRDMSLKYFNESFNSPILFREMKDVIDRIRLSGCSSDYKGSNLRIQEVMEILKAYEKALEEGKLFDYPELLKKDVPLYGDSIFAVPCDFPVHKLEREFLSSLKPVVLSSYRYDRPIPRSFYSRLVGDYSSEDKSPENVIYRAFPSEDEEVFSVFEELTSKDISPQEVELVVSSDSLLDKVLSFGEIFGIKVFPEDGNFIRSSKLEEFLYLLKDFTESNFSFLVFEKIIRGDFLCFEGLDLLSLLANLEKKAFSFGAWNYRSEEEAFQNFLDDFLSLIQKDVFKKVNYSKELEKFIVFFNKYLREEIKYENKDLFYRLLHDKSSLIYGDMTYSLFLDRLIASIEKKKIDRDMDPPYLLVRKSYLPFTRDYAYVMGMTSSYYPDEGGWSKILSDEELSDISKDIITFSDDREGKEYSFDSMLPSYKGRGGLVFSYSEWDLTKDIENVPHLLIADKAERMNVDNKLILNVDRDKALLPLDQLEKNRNWDIIREFSFSYSSLEQLMKCPKCFYNKYILKLDGEKETEDERISPREMGNLYHKILEKFIQWAKGKANLDKNSSLDALNRIADEEINRYKLSSPPQRERIFLDEIYKMKDSLEGYFYMDLINKLNDFKAMRTELAFEERVCVGKYKLLFRGRVDRIEDYKDRLVIVDLKTGNRKYKEEEMKKNKSYQDYVYRKVLQGDKEVSMEYHFIKEDAEDKMRLVSSAKLEVMEEKIEKTIDLVLKYGFLSSENFINLPPDYKILELSAEEIIKNHQFKSFICRR